MKLLIVIHETLTDLNTVVHLVQSPSFGASYHSAIRLNGEIIYLTPANKKAYGASHSKFINSEGEEESVDGSIDDFAYHIALETPDNGQDNNINAHSGYTNAQYKSLAWLISKTGVADDRITTHKNVSLSGSQDPRSFDLAQLNKYLSRLKKEKIFDFGILN